MAQDSRFQTFEQRQNISYFIFISKHKLLCSKHNSDLCFNPLDHWLLSLRRLHKTDYLGRLNTFWIQNKTRAINCLITICETFIWCFILYCCVFTRYFPCAGAASSPQDSWMVGNKAIKPKLNIQKGVFTATCFIYWC